MNPGADVLVVDDDPAVRMMLSSMLELEGYAVRTAIDGLEALARCSERIPALLLLDLAMPRLNGFDVLRSLGGNGAPRFPVLVVTARTGACEEAARLGADDCIAKPFEIDDLLARVALLVNRSTKDGPA